MALCKDCIHYNVCEQWAKDVSDEWAVDAMPYACDLFQSTADVAPKSEVAREIFEEIEKNAIEHEMFGRTVLFIGQGTLAELKKKYTEEK